MQPALTPEDITKIGQRMFGRRAWQIRMARALGTHKSTVYRWSLGRMKIDPMPSRLIRELDAKHRARRAEERALR